MVCADVTISGKIYSNILLEILCRFSHTLFHIEIVILYSNVKKKSETLWQYMKNRAYFKHNNPITDKIGNVRNTRWKTNYQFPGLL